MPAEQLEFQFPKQVSVADSSPSVLTLCAPPKIQLPGLLPGEKACMLKRDGTLFNLLDPDYSTITADDVAWGLSSEVRYGGQSPIRENVAAHSYTLARRALYTHGPKVAVCCLFHDAPEAFIGDMIGPLKHLSVLAWFGKVLERLHMERICERFGLPPMTDPIWQVVEELDHAVVNDEKPLLWEGLDPGYYHAELRLGVDKLEELDGIGNPITMSEYDSEMAFMRLYREFQAFGACK